MTIHTITMTFLNQRPIVLPPSSKAPPTWAPDAVVLDATRDASALAQLVSIAHDDGLTVIPVPQGDPYDVTLRYGDTLQFKFENKISNSPANMLFFRQMRFFNQDGTEFDILDDPDFAEKFLPPGIAWKQGRIDTTQNLNPLTLPISYSTPNDRTPPRSSEKILTYAILLEIPPPNQAGPPPGRDPANPAQGSRRVLIDPSINLQPQG